MVWFIAGVPARHLFVLVGATIIAVVPLIMTSQHRLARFAILFQGGKCTEAQKLTICYQTLHGQFALATGGWWGVGLGASRQKWGGLPEASNDFIFAILGEELGLAGTLVVLAVYAVLIYALIRIVLASPDPFVQVATAGIVAWIASQTLINIGTVVGVVPVVGVPLPLVSSGGSALITTLLAIGIVLSFARRLPGVAEAMAARPGMVKRSLAILPGRDADGRRWGGQR